MLILLSFSFRSYCQFYDSDDEIRIYLNENSGDQPKYYVFNFNGSKGVKLWTNGYAYDKILEDENYFEKKIYNPGSDAEFYYYSGDKSNHNYECYEHKSSTFSTVTNSMFTVRESIYFSLDGNKILKINSYNNHMGTNVYSNTWRRVSKQELIDAILKYKNKKNKTWR